MLAYGCVLWFMFVFVARVCDCLYLFVYVCRFFFVRLYLSAYARV